MKHLWLVAKSFFPRRLPTGMRQFNDWISDIIYISGLPDNNSTRSLAATFLFHISPNVGYISIRTISNQLVKAAAMQVAKQVIDDVKESIKTPPGTMVQ